MTRKHPAMFSAMMVPPNIGAVMSMDMVVSVRGDVLMLLMMMMTGCPQSVRVGSWSRGRDADQRKHQPHHRTP